MSKRMLDSELKNHITEALNGIKKLLTDWATAPLSADQDAKEAEHNRKRAQLLAYWLKTYAKLLNRENNFNPKSIPRLTRRQIVNVDFGFRIGSELGGLHYAVVLDKDNDHSAKTVAVIPLGSQKEGFGGDKKRIVLKDGVCAALQSKVDTQSGGGEDCTISLAKMAKLKKGTVANISQVTTISKMRIKEPLTPADALYKVKISEKDMEQIETALLDMYVSKGACRSFVQENNIKNA